MDRFRLEYFRDAVADHKRRTLEFHPCWRHAIGAHDRTNARKPDGSLSSRRRRARPGHEVGQAASGVAPSQGGYRPTASPGTISSASAGERNGMALI